MVMHARILFVIVWIFTACDKYRHENKVQEMAYKNVQCQQAGKQ
jgi:hypothetical protein